MKRIALVLLIAPACTIDMGLGSDPYAGIADDPCQPGNVRETQQACVLPSSHATIDGAIAEWSSVKSLAATDGCMSGTCEPALVVEHAQLARYSTARGYQLEFHVQLAAPPLTTDPDAQYIVQLNSTYQRWRDDIDELVASASTVRYQRNGLFIEVPSDQLQGYAFHWTDDGFEGSINSDYVPFPDGANIVFYTKRGDQTVFSPAPMLGCWADDDVASDPCSGVGPGVTP